MNIVWLIIMILGAMIFLPLFVWEGIHAKKVATELCKHCIHKGCHGKYSPCYNCMDGDNFERVDGDG